MDKVQKYNSFNTNTPSSESYRNYLYMYQFKIIAALSEHKNSLKKADMTSFPKPVL
jgi:hypothetical protein